MKTLFLSTAFAALALGANAQSSIGFGAEVGTNLSSLRQTFGDEKNTSSTNAGIRAGAFVNIGIGEQLAIQPGLFFSQKGGKFEEDGLTLDYRINYIELPVNVVYHFNNDQTGFFLSAGAYGALAFGGNVEVDLGGVSLKRDLEIGDTEDSSGGSIRRFDLGFQAGAGYQLKNGLLFRAQYMLGAQNIANYNNSDNALRNGAIALTVGYRFGGQK